jgi:hypothetical protein
MKTIRTLKNWGNDSSLLFSPNTTKTKAETELTKLVTEEFGSYIQVPFYELDYLRTHKSKGCDKLYVYTWRWNGSWADPSKELSAVFYKPKK